MTTTTYHYANFGVSQAEVRRTVDPAAVVVARSKAVFVDVTIDDTLKEQLDFTMELAGYTETPAQTAPMYRRTLDGWTSLGVAAGLAAAGLARWNLAQVAVALVARDGTVTGVDVLLDTPAAGAALVVEVYLNGVATGLLATVGVGATQASASGSVAVVAGDLLDLRVTTGAGWTAVLANLAAALELEA